ncbi:hypothetical protein [Streptomyces sp. MT206]|uniref:hypothetical protein n=1 Tax=Streptomyces sp. MT206 TaxID=3031407 RepID=UPI002FC6EB9A
MKSPGQLPPRPSSLPPRPPRRPAGVRWCSAPALRLALDGALTPADVRLLLPEVTAPPRPGAPAGQAGWSRRLAARWARTLPVAERNGDWLVVAEGLLKDAVDAEHAGRGALLAVAAPPHTASPALWGGGRRGRGRRGRGRRGPGRRGPGRRQRAPRGRAGSGRGGRVPG